MTWVMIAEATPMLPEVPAALPGVRWFSGGGCVIELGDEIEVRVGGVIVGRYARGEVGARNAILVGLAEDRKMHLGELAAAFRISTEMLRRIRRRHESEGLVSVVATQRGGKRPVVDGRLRERIWQLFEAGLSVSEVHAKVRRGRRIGRTSVWQERRRWETQRPGTPLAGAHEPDERTPSQGELDLGQSVTTNASSTPAASAVEADGTGTDGGPSGESAATASPAGPVSSAEDAVHGGGFVQHVGGWLLLAHLCGYGLYEQVEAICGRRTDEERLDGEAVRVAIDAFAIALALGQGCVEGVRRIATPSAHILLRAEGVPCADRVRRTLGRLADVGAEDLHLGMMRRYLEAARTQETPAVFYVDNHLRPYTGQEVIRRGWRMQDKRVRPGTTDYYVHDAEGRPVMRIASPSHAPLTEVIFTVGDTLRVALGDDVRFLLAFDRAGAYPETLAGLRNQSFEFVTYERRPYRILQPAEFTKERVLDPEDEEASTIRYREFHVALGKGRGDIRRVAMRMPDERQVNLVGISPSSADVLIDAMSGRWHQENGIKHSVERWGINQLDGRRTIAYPPGTVVPNPARRRLDHALRLACAREGRARNELARLVEDDPKREGVLEDLHQAIAEQEELLARRPSTPARAPLAETELAGKLVHHTVNYKLVLDTVRIAAANAEADLAARLAPYLPRAAEAKKTLGNLLAAPGRVRPAARTIHVDLAPAGTGPEQAAFRKLFADLNAGHLSLPGDPKRRRLRFGAQL